LQDLQLGFTYISILLLIYVNLDRLTILKIAWREIESGTNGREHVELVAKQPMVVARIDGLGRRGNAGSELVWLP
jgi:hypothetical protein